MGLHNSKIMLKLLGKYSTLYLRLKRFEVCCSSSSTVMQPRNGACSSILIVSLKILVYSSFSLFSNSITLDFYKELADSAVPEPNRYPHLHLPSEFPHRPPEFFMVFSEGSCVVFSMF